MKKKVAGELKIFERDLQDYLNESKQARSNNNGLTDPMKRVAASINRCVHDYASDVFS